MQNPYDFSWAVWHKTTRANMRLRLHVSANPSSKELSSNEVIRKSGQFYPPLYFRHLSSAPYYKIDVITIWLPYYFEFFDNDHSLFWQT